MGALLGLDLGSVRVGVAVCEEGVFTATPLVTLEFKSRKYLLEELSKLIRQYTVSEIVVGLPQTLKGECGPAAQKVKENVEWLKSHTEVKWTLWDERLTSKEAERILLAADVSRARRKEVIDQLAAQRILQTYLDSREH